MITSQQYKERIAKLKNNVFQNGKYVNRFDPKIIGGINPGWPLENPPPVAGSKSPTPGSAERVFI